MIYENTFKDKFYPVREINTLKDLINTSKELYGKKTAFLHKESKGGKYKEINYITFKDDIDALGTKLVSMGMKGEKIAIIGENCYSWIVSYFAVVNGVGTVVPLDKELSENEIKNLLKAADCKAIFYTDGFKNIIKNIDIDYKFEMNMYFKLDDEESSNEYNWKSLIYNGRKLISENNTEYINTKIDSDKPEIFLFTSGTTDLPKAVMLSHGNIVSNIKDVSRIVKLKSDDRMLSILPIHHTFESTIGIMVPLYQGASIAFFEGLKYINKNLIEAKATVLVGVPLIFESMYNKIWKQAEKNNKSDALKFAIKSNKIMNKIGINMQKKLFKTIHEGFGGNLRLLVCGAAAINPNVIRGFKDIGIDTVMGYGLTETSPLVSGTPDFSDRYAKAGSVGMVVPSGKIKLVDIDESGIGEFIYSGDNVMKGYYQNPEKTNEVLKDGWFYTGDLGFIDSSGWIYITGRKKNIIVTKTGKNIYPEEIEAILSEIKYINECMVYGTENDQTGETIVSVQIKPNYEVINDEFNYGENQTKIYKLLKGKIADINQKLPNYKMIRNVVIRDKEFLKTTTHKIKRGENI